LGPQLVIWLSKRTKAEYLVIISIDHCYERVINYALRRVEQELPGLIPRYRINWQSL
jgi:hypothetical protein